jgi:uncharacterized phage protein (TIGR02220 family)
MIKRIEVLRANGGTFTMIENHLLTDPTVSPVAKAVYAILCKHADNRTSNTVASRTTFSSELGVTPKTITESIKKLEKAKWIVVKRKHKAVSQYWVGVKPPPDNPIDSLGVDFTPLEGSDDTLSRVETTQILNTDYTDKHISVIPKKRKRKGFSITQEEREKIKEIIGYLNMVTGRNYDWRTLPTQKLLKARMSEPENYKVEGFKLVIDHKFREWGKPDNPYKKYLRPDTLFKQDKMENYFNEALADLERSGTDGS